MHQGDTQNLINQIYKINDVSTFQKYKLTKDDVTKTDTDDRTPFFHACEAGKLEIAEYLYEIEPSTISMKATNDRTPLHVACQRGHLPIVHFLLDRHAEVNAVTRQNETPLHLVAKECHSKIVEILLDYHINSRFFSNVKMANQINLNI